MKKVWKTFLQKIFIMAVISGVLIAASILAYRSTCPKELTLSEDGYYEIYTAYDFDRFWQMVSHDQIFICGRLMNDIYLNDVSNFAKWQTMLLRDKAGIFIFSPVILTEADTQFMGFTVKMDLE